MTRNFQSKLAKILLALVGLISLGTATGCDELWPGVDFPGGYYNGWSYGYPSFGYYDPTDLIQGVVDYRLDAMETAANGWDEFIMQ
ncbi:MAG: hypothetical protein JXQ75_13740 [Phycisphaerae bacterium]|nr:hypothetical protein [Phycisphaerae bacterium]